MTLVNPWIASHAIDIDPPTYPHIRSSIASTRDACFGALMILKLKGLPAGTAAGSLAEKATGQIKASEDEIAFEGAQVVTPANATLVQDLNLR